ncbi:MAG: FMN-binding protein [Ruminococcaceae bacterium]|nr:FMN-binding protein [Oscillospiraceae bacterium]
MKNNIKNLVVFVLICTVMTLLLATTNFFTAPIIKENQNASANKALLEVMPDGEGFEQIDISTFTLPATVSEVYKATNGQGYVIKLVTTGYGSDMVIMCGVKVDGTVTGAVCLSSNETLSKEKTYGENFALKDAAGVEAVDTIAGATKTTAAYKNAVKDALSSVIILGGGSVDLRSEEEILNDNLSTALPDGEKKFQKVFMVELLEGIDAVYEAENKSGYVFVSGQQFIGVKADGSVVTAGVEDTKLYSDAVEKIKSTTLKDVNFSKYEELKNTIVSVKKTASGNFVIEAKGAGYGIKGGDEYHPASNEYIIVRVAVTKDFKIIDCITVSEAETDGVGDACADESFYGQFVGKTDKNYTEIDAIGGATMTTDGYKQAIERAFNAVKILGGAR